MQIESCCLHQEKAVDDRRRLFQLNSPCGELNLLRKRNWLVPAKLPVAAKGEFNLALCDSIEFSCEAILLAP
jgi:hypothetical protein